MRHSDVGGSVNAEIHHPSLGLSRYWPDPLPFRSLLLTLYVSRTDIDGLDMAKAITCLCAVDTVALMKQLDNACRPRGGTSCQESMSAPFVRCPRCWHIWPMRVYMY